MFPVTDQAATETVAPVSAFTMLASCSLAAALSDACLLCLCCGALGSVHSMAGSRAASEAGTVPVGHSASLQLSVQSLQVPSAWFWSSWSIAGMPVSTTVPVLQK